MSTKTNLEKLQKIWYEKLKKSGFDDIENENGELTRGLPRVTNQAPIQIEVIQHYYSWARSFLHEHEFKSEFEKAVWELHSEGIAVRAISVELRRKGYKKQKDAVWYVVKRLEQLMKAKYLPTT